MYSTFLYTCNGSCNDQICTYVLPLCPLPLLLFLPSLPPSILPPFTPSLFLSTLPPFPPSLSSFSIEYSKVLQQVIQQLRKDNVARCIMQISTSSTAIIRTDEFKMKIQWRFHIVLIHLQSGGIIFGIKKSAT